MIDDAVLEGLRTNINTQLSGSGKIRSRFLSSHALVTFDLNVTDLDLQGYFKVTVHGGISVNTALTFQGTASSLNIKASNRQL